MDSFLNAAFYGCSSEVDDTWYIEWPNTLRGATSIQLCPGGQAAIGIYVQLLALQSVQFG